MIAVILTASNMKKEISGNTYYGKCVTAYDLDNNKIVRFVRNDDGAPVEYPFCDMFHPLDIVDISINRSCPQLCQTENVMANYQRATILGKYENGIQGIYKLYIHNIRVSHSYMRDGSYKVNDISTFDHSLELVRVSNLEIDGKKCSFMCGGKNYKYVSVTDPDYASMDGRTKLGEAILAVSIPTNNYQGKGYFKFVAAIFPI